MGDERRLLGMAGEDAAVGHLLSRGFQIEVRNFRTRYGELDIIARDGDTLVFVEVRTKSSRIGGDPLETVSRSKQAKVVKMARWYLASRKVSDRTPCRFDVIGIVWAPGTAPQITHVENAFQT